MKHPNTACPKGAVWSLYSRARGTSLYHSQHTPITQQMTETRASVTTVLPAVANEKKVNGSENDHG
jgi:hypothetical protein